MEFDHAGVVYSLLRGATLEIHHAGELVAQLVTVAPDGPVTRPVTMPPARERPGQPAGRVLARRVKIPEAV